MKTTHISVAGTGYVGLSNAVLLSLNNDVTAFDINAEKVDAINNRKSPIADEYIEKYMSEKNLNLTATTDALSAFSNADFVIISTPTNYDTEKDYFDTSSIETVLNQISSINNNDVVIVIKSTIPVGYTNRIRKKYSNLNILFSPEFLREGKALYDNLYPSRIIVGTDLDNEYLVNKANEFIELLKAGAIKENIPSLVMDYASAESVKLFSNTYLALRVAYFNELDTYAQEKNLNTSDIIKGVCMDPRIGDFYNNPSFGYGGYCLPKDTKQLLTNYNNVPNNIIEAIVESNSTRKNFIAEKITEQHPNHVGIYRLTMKTDSDNFRESAIWDIMDSIRAKGIDLFIYEPTVNQDNIQGIPVVNDFTLFKNMSDLIIANRYDSDLEDVRDKVYTRDIYQRD